MTDNPLALAGKRALVTGASGALGQAIARRLARDGATLLLHANRGADVIEQLAAELRAAGGAAECHVFDVADADASRVFPGMSAPQWHRVIDVSLHGFFHVTQPLVLPMLRTRWGRIINISSVAALMGNRGQVNYAAAKGALNSATKALSLEVASRGVTVNAVAPGIIASPMADGSFDAATIAQLVPAKRAGRPEEVADLVGFLASPMAAYISGQVIAINGGMC
jgi:3-oxoacyl-[acyl-carrier protein] reductase